MSLTETFFEERQQTLERWRGNGYQEQEDVMQQNGITEEQLLEAGLLEMRSILSTAELYRASSKSHSIFLKFRRVYHS